MSLVVIPLITIQTQSQTSIRIITVNHNTSEQKIEGVIINIHNRESGLGTAKLYLSRIVRGKTLSPFYDPLGRMPNMGG